jgi:hypothetical protein
MRLPRRSGLAGVAWQLSFGQDASDHPLTRLSPANWPKSSLSALSQNQVSHFQPKIRRSHTPRFDNEFVDCGEFRLMFYWVRI